MSSERRTQSGEFLSYLAKIADECGLTILGVAPGEVTLTLTVKRAAPLAYYHPIVTIQSSGGLAVFVEAIAQALVALNGHD